MPDAKKKTAPRHSVRVEFTGLKPEVMAQRFYTYLVDGGLEDILMQNISDHELTLEIESFSTEPLAVTFRCKKTGTLG